MKKLLQIAAVLSFLFPFLSGARLLLWSIGGGEEAWFTISLGSFLIGNGIFVGAMLLVAAEKLNREDGSQ
jgi:hypothetical protein